MGRYIFRDVMRLILIIFLIIPLTSYACMKGVILPELTVQNMPQPKFKAGLEIKYISGELKAVVSTNHLGEVIKYNIISVTPAGLPMGPIEASLKKAKFSHESKDDEVILYFDIYIPEKITPIIEL
jgi:hypothetical protein